GAIGLCRVTGEKFWWSRKFASQHVYHFAKLIDQFKIRLWCGVPGLLQYWKVPRRPPVAFAQPIQTSQLKESSASTDRLLSPERFLFAKRRDLCNCGEVFAYT